MKTKIFITALVLLLSSVAMAEVKDPQNTPIIDLGSGTIAAAATTQISFIDPKHHLVDNIAYDVECKIVDKNNPQNQVIMATQTKYTSGAVGSFYLNGEELGTATWSVQYKLPKVDNFFKATKMYSFCESLNFTNADQTDSVDYVCQATPSL